VSQSPNTMILLPSPAFQFCHRFLTQEAEEQSSAELAEAAEIADTLTEEVTRLQRELDQSSSASQSQVRPLLCFRRKRSLCNELATGERNGAQRFVAALDLVQKRPASKPASDGIAGRSQSVLKEAYDGSYVNAYWKCRWKR